MLSGMQEMGMNCYAVWPTEDEAGDSCYVLASSSAEARRLVALNIDEASDARDSDKFECVLSVDKHKRPLLGFIHRRLHGPVSIVNR